MSKTTYIKTTDGTPYTYTNGHISRPGWFASIPVGSARTVSDAVEIAKSDSGSRVDSIRTRR